MSGRHAHRQREVTSLEVDGNKGGSYVRLGSTEREGFCALEVGETCVVTVRQELPVAWLAAVLTYACDEGWETILQRYGWDPEIIARVAQ